MAGNNLPVVVSGLDYTANIITLSAAQVAGTAPLLAANPSRKALQFAGTSNFRVCLIAGQTAGVPIGAALRDSMIGGECPKNALYHVPNSGLMAGSTLVIWEA